MQSFNQKDKLADHNQLTSGGGRASLNAGSMTVSFLNPALYFFRFEVFIPHLGWVHATLVLIRQVHSGLTWLDPMTNKIIDYTWSIQPRPR
jgi:hypothetical protein